VKPVDLEISREPPIAVLPFSIAKSTTEPASAPPQHSFFGAAKTDGTPKPPTLVSSQPSKLPAPVISSVPIAEPNPTSGPLILPATAPTSSGNGNIPNFFASSQFLAKAPTPPVPVPVLNFAASPTHTEQAPLVPRPVKDAENPFWDGEKDFKLSDDKSAQNILPALGKTGTPSGSALAPVLLASSSVADAPTSALPFTFNKPTEAKPEAPNFGSTTMGELKQLFSFPAQSKQASLDEAASSGENVPSSVPPSFLGEAPKLLGKLENSTSAFGQVVPTQSSPSPLSFTFGSQNPSKTEPKATFVGSESTSGLGSTSSSTLEGPKPSFGGINGGNVFSFDQTPDRCTDQDATKPASFSFSTSPAPVVAPKPVEEPKPVAEPKPVFPFGQPSDTTAGATASSPVTFGFSSGGSTSADVSTRQSFIFGQHNVVAPTERPVTPPRNPDNEFRMEESPTREIQQSNEANKPALALGSGFSFNASTPIGTSLFGGGPQKLTSPLAPTSPFSFSSSSPSNPFAPKDKAEEAKAFGGFGQASTVPSAPSNSFAPTDKTDESKPFGTFGKTNAVSSTSIGFSFGQMTKASEETQRPPTTGSFSFNTTPTSATTSSPFSFGTPQNANPFGQATSSSAPSSPSTFTQPSPFAFGAPAPSTNTSFGFGSQPTSPAGGANLTLPQPSSSGFTFGQQAPQPSSPFGAPIPLAPSTSSTGALFTIGAAPAPAGVAGGPRQIRKLPNRRGGKR
jgi:nucleoporin NUP1